MVGQWSYTLLLAPDDNYYFWTADCGKFLIQVKVLISKRAGFLSPTLYSLGLNASIATRRFSHSVRVPVLAFLREGI